MSIAEQDRVCSDLIQKVSSGQPLTEFEKTHLIECASCMAALVLHLDKSPPQVSGDADTSAATGVNGTTPGQLVAQQALEHGRKVFEREFGLSLTRE